MLSANEIKNVRFSKAVGGYKQDEVDILLDKVEADYEQFERTVREMNKKIAELNAELEEARNAQGNIQNIIMSAQRFADQLVEEAKTKSAEIIASAQESIKQITEQEKELTTEFDRRAGERKEALQSDVEIIIENAQKKQDAIQAATQDCVDSQQALFGRLKTEVATFKAEITAIYKEHLELLASLPDSVAGDPSEVAAAVEAEFAGVPTVEEYVENPEKFDLHGDDEETQPEEPAEKFVGAVTGKGFVINSEEFDDDETEDDDDDK